MVDLGLLRKIRADHKRVCILCRTQKESDDVRFALHNAGYCWSNGDSLIDFDNYIIGRGGIKYFLGAAGRVLYGRISYTDDGYEEINCFVNSADDDDVEFDTTRLVEWCSELTGC